MATGAEVLFMLLPKGGYVISGNDYDGIKFLEAEPITRAEFEAGFPKVDTWKAKQDADKAAAKAAAEAKLEALGLTPDDLRALGL
jgi:hypothetical protein